MDVRQVDLSGTDEPVERRSWVERVDSSRLAPAVIAHRVVDRHFDRQKQRAATDPTWAAIEARRERGGGTAIFLSEDLTWEDFDTQMKIEERLTPSRLSVKVARRVKDVTLYGSLRAVRHAYQRQTRGWADSDVWDLGNTNAYRIGQQLLYLSRIAHGWPSDEEFPTYEDWERAIRHHGSVLIEKTDDRSFAHQQAMNHWLSLDRRSAAKDAKKAAWERLREVEVADHEAVKASLRWVADHYDQLWD